MEKKASQARFLERYPDVLSMKQLTELLQVSKKTAYGLIQSGRIQSIKVGREHRIPKPFILNFLGIDQTEENKRDACRVNGVTL